MGGDGQEPVQAPAGRVRGQLIGARFICLRPSQRFFRLLPDALHRLELGIRPLGFHACFLGLYAHSL